MFAIHQLYWSINYILRNIALFPYINIYYNINGKEDGNKLQKYSTQLISLKYNGSKYRYNKMQGYCSLRLFIYSYYNNKINKINYLKLVQ